MQPLSTLPNREGFKFRGIRKDGGRYMNCRLKHLPGTGMFIVAAGRYVYEDVSHELAGWEPHPKYTVREEQERPTRGVKKVTRHAQGDRASAGCSRKAGKYLAESQL